ncbi:hypothetical protein TrVE_jg10787 [Triparma verrucosa]|uniref:Uncharacterized protein n=1 Tax=Triparma verrucosa TaxID=1606542 RepID=A0A9W7BQ27_9STRA|nr:hypothetical protein TrVE_jg10787 [Triparma verrucosa]
MKGVSRSPSFLKSNSNSESSPENYLSSSLDSSSLDLSLLPPSYYPSSFPSSSIISSLPYTVPQALGIYVINEAQPFTIQGKEEDVKRYLEMKSPSIVGNDEVEEMCTITTKGELQHLFTYVSSSSTIIPSSPDLLPQFTATTFPMDGVTLTPSSQISISLLTLQPYETLLSNLPPTTQIIPQKHVTPSNLPSLKHYLLIFPSQTFPSTLHSLTPPLSSDKITLKLLQIPPPVYEYYTITTPRPPYTGLLKSVTPLDLKLPLEITRKCYTGAEGLSKRIIKEEFTHTILIFGRRGKGVIRFNAVENEDRVERFLEGEGEEGDYPPGVGGEVRGEEGEVLGTLLEVGVGFEDSVGLAVLKRSSVEKFNVEVGMRVWAGGSWGVLEELDMSGIEIDKEASDFTPEKKEDEDVKALKKQERMDELKRKAQELIKRRNAKKEKKE